MGAEAASAAGSGRVVEVLEASMNLDDNRMLATRICEALGLEPSNVTELSMRFDTSGLIHVSADIIVTDGKLIGKAFEDYKLMVTKVTK